MNSATAVGETRLREAISRLQGADTWVFDLDDTLYSSETKFFSQIDRRIGAFISNLMGLDPIEARKIQKSYFSRYGTTLKGLMDLHDVQPDDFLNYVHDVDLSQLTRDEALVSALKGLDGRKYVFTNSPLEYARQVLERLGIAEFMDGIFDVAASNYIPKPRQPAYDRLVSAFNLQPAKTVYVEDMARNLIPAAKMGMITVWLCTGEKWGAHEHDPEHVDFEIVDLPQWLAGVAEGRA
ncbi:MAG: pyrimidine 5'-nucleotidase [Proteobacteria bacterium]|nr:pyrimidine 5'-nucleotidase [Pseudomonadota bacterium]